MTPREKLEKAYRQAQEAKDKTFGLTTNQQEHVQWIVRNAEAQKAVLAAVITSLLKKIITPEQDIRRHKIEQTGGYSGRSFDTSYVTPFLRETFPRLAMRSGSGWLTRSIEQNSPFTRDFPGKIQNAGMKQAFLEIVHDVQENGDDPNAYLLSLLSDLKSAYDVPPLVFAEVSVNSEATVGQIMTLLRDHFFAHHKGAGASRLPVLAIYAIYESLMQLPRYQGKVLAPLKAHTTSDTKSRSYADVEIMTAENALFEGVEIKHNIRINPTLVADAYEKFAPTPAKRYYLLTTAEPNIENEEKVGQLVEKIRREHGCEVIVNGLLPSLKYYLRLLPDPPAFLETYTRVLQADFQQSADIKTVHLEKWQALLSDVQNDHKA